MESPAEFKVAPGVDGPALALSGYWTAEQMGPAARDLSRALREEGKPSFDLTQVGRLDTAGAYAILRANGVALGKPDYLAHLGMPVQL